jgi:diaminopimelate decarboxylase
VWEDWIIEEPEGSSSSAGCIPNNPPILQSKRYEMKTRLPYAPPSIKRNSVQQTNKFGYGSYAPACEEIDGVPVSELTQKFGSPLFVYSENQIRTKVRAAKRAFEKRYPKVQFAWSYKTCYLQAICAVFHDEGSIAEVVSEFEYEKARKLGVPGRDILVNGPCKTGSLLRRAIDEKAKLHLDNLNELFELEVIAREKGVTVDVAIRVNMDTGLLPAWSKFGFNLENGEAMQAIRRMKANGLIRLVGLHAHIGTFVLEPRFYKTAAEKLIRLGRQVKTECGFVIEYFDLGGGFASNNSLHAHYLPGEQIVPTFDQYAEAICDTFTTEFAGSGKLPQLYLESGRALIDEAGYLITSIIAQKNAPDGRRALIADCGVNMLYTTTWYRLNTRPAKRNPAPVSDTILYGPLCMNIDVVRESVQLPPMERGDQLVLHPVGAYNVVQSMQFIMYRPVVVLIGAERQCEVIRKRENLDYVESMEVLPEYLSP